MKKVFFSLLAVIAIMTSCGGINAVDYNNKVVEIQNNIVKEATRFSNEVQKVAQTRDFSSIRVEADSSLAVIDAEVAKLKEMDAPSGGEEFKEAVIKAFESYKNVFEKGAAASTFTESTTQEELIKYVNDFTAAVNESTELENQAKEAQKAFAEKHGITVL